MVDVMVDDQLRTRRRNSCALFRRASAYMTLTRAPLPFLDFNRAGNVPADSGDSMDSEDSIDVPAPTPVDAPTDGGECSRRASPLCGHQLLNNLRSPLLLQNTPQSYCIPSMYSRVSPLVEAVAWQDLT